MEQVSIKVTIKSFEQSAIDMAIKKLTQLAQIQESINQRQSFAIQDKQTTREKNYRLKIISRTALPPSIRKFTVLRSPHIDKKSREQFQQKELAATIGLRPVAISLTPLLLSLLKNSQLIGVQQKVKVTLATALYK